MAEIQPDPRFPWIIDPMESKIHFQKLPRSNGIQELLASFTIGSEWTIDSTLYLVERSSVIIDRVYGIDVHIWSRFRISLPGLAFPVPSPLPGLLCPGPSVPPASFPPRSYLPVPPRHRLFRPLCPDPSIRSSLSRSHSLVLSVLAAPSVLSVHVPPRSSVPVPFPGPYVPSASVPFPGLLCPGPVSSLFRFYPGPLCPGSITVLSVPVPYRFHLFRSHTGFICSGPTPVLSVLVLPFPLLRSHPRSCLFRPHPRSKLSVPAPIPGALCPGPFSWSILSRSRMLFRSHHRSSRSRSHPQSFLLQSHYLSLSVLHPATRSSLYGSYSLVLSIPSRSCLFWSHSPVLSVPVPLPLCYPFLNEVKNTDHVKLCPTSPCLTTHGLGAE